MTSFNKTSKCALSLLLAVMMLFTSVLTGADALTKTAQDTAQAAFEAAVDTEAEAAAATAAANEAEDAAQADETAPEQDASATAQETAQPDAEETAQTQTVKTDAAEPETETVRTDVSVKKTPEKSGATGSNVVTVFFDNVNEGNTSDGDRLDAGNIQIYAYNNGDELVGAWSSTPSMTKQSGSIYAYTFNNIPDTGFNVIIKGSQNWDNKGDKQSTTVFIDLENYSNPLLTRSSWVEDNGTWKFGCTVSEATAYTVYFDNSDTNWSNVYGYTWTGGNTYSGIWPGTKMVQDTSTGNYVLTVYDTEPSNILFAESSSGEKTIDYSFEDGKTYTPTMLAYGNYSIHYGLGDSSLNNTATVGYVPGTSSYFAEIDTSNYTTSNRIYFALFNGSSAAASSSTSVTNNSTDWLSSNGSTAEHNNVYVGNFGFNDDNVTSVKIGVNTSNVTYTLSATATPYNLFAKDGTVRTNTSYFHQKYANFCDTTIVRINDNTSPTVGNETYYEKANVSAGDVVTIKTTIAAPYNNAYYVKGFCVNGVTYGSIEEPGTADSRRTSNTGGEYTLTYTVPENFTYIEITPIYFYIENGGTYSDLGFVTFHVEKYTEGIQEKWGNTIACQTWYTNGVESSNGLTAEVQNNTQNALGGFPGQPLVYENGDFYMQVPKKLPVNGSSANVTVQGMTLSNYYWDDVHQDLAKKDEDFRGNANTTSDHRCNNAQTYDYNDFAALAKMGAEDIIFTFKYRTKLFNRQSVDANYLNDFGSGILNVKYKTGWNGWDALVDYHDRAVDLAGNILTNPDSNAPYTESDLVDDNPGDGNKTYTPAEAAEMIWIVSKGYQDIKGTTGNGYYGNYATSWDFYKYVVGTGFVKINTNYSLPGSSFVPPETAYETVDEDGHLPTDTSGDPYYDHAKYEINKTRYLAFSDDSGSFRNDTYAEFVKVYNETLGKLTMISFEQSKLAYANYNGVEDVSGINYSSGTTNYTSSVKYNNPAYRCDGRWYYSKADSGDVKAHLLIEYKNSVDTSYTKDTYTSGGVGVKTGAALKFTTPDNDDATKVWKDTEGVHAVDTYSPDEFFAFNAPSYSTGENNKVYKFVGWYLLIGSNYTPINPADIANVNGKHVRNVTNNYVARYEEISGEYAIIDHRVIMNSSGTAAKGGGNGNAYTTVQVYNNTPALRIPLLLTKTTGLF